MNASTLTSIGVERRAIPMDLFEIRNVIAKSRLDDPMTQTISTWLQNFSESPKTPEVKKEYVSMMQKILIDPITKAPILNAVLGKPCEVTYEWKAVKVYQWLAKEPYKSRSSRWSAIPSPNTW